MLNFRFLASARRCLAVLAIFAWVASFILSFQQAGQAQTPPQYIAGEVLIKLRAGVPPAAVQDLLTRTQGKPLEALGRLGWIRVRLMGNQNLGQMIPLLRRFPQVAMAEPNFIVHADGIPNDTDFGKLWGLNNTGQAGGTAGVDIDAPEAWDHFVPAGNTVVVAVIDTGIDYTHPDLASRIWTNPREIPGNGIDDDGNGYVDDTKGWDFVNNDNDPMDDNNHGTHVSGTIAGVFNNNAGVAGVAGPANVKLMPLKFLDNTGSGTTSNAIKALDYATANGAVISNNSWGGASYSQALADAIARNHQAGRLFVAAAGNNSANTDSAVFYPQGYNIPNVISVASITSAGTLSSFSNYGAQTVDLAAPGSNIYSTVRGGYAVYNGTSMATPHVVGAAALVWAQTPAFTNLQVKQILLDTSSKTDSLKGKTVSGGILNLKNAIMASGASGAPVLPPPTASTSAVIVTPTSTVPASPSRLVGRPSSFKQKAYRIRYAKLSWQDNSSNETGFEIWRSIGIKGTFSRYRIVAANSTSFIDQISRNLMSADYYYKIRAYNQKGPSRFSNTIKIARF